MSKLTDAAIEDNIGRAVACLKAARMTLHAGAKSPQQARKNRRLGAFLLNPGAMGFEA